MVGEQITLGICVSQVVEHITLGICASQVWEHITLGICVSQVGELKAVGICFFQVGEHIIPGRYVSLAGEHLTLWICVSQVGEHRTLGMLLSYVCIEILKSRSKPFLIATWYRPPTSSTEIFSHFETLISKLDSASDEFYLMISTVTLLCVKPMTILCYFLMYRMSTVFINLSTF